MKRALSISLLACALASSAWAAAGARLTLHLDGRLLDAGGGPMDGTYLLDFRVFVAPQEGSEIWRESQYVLVKEGFFAVELGLASPLPERLLGEVYRVEAHAPAGLPWKPVLSFARLKLPSSDQKIRRLEENIDYFKRSAERAKKEVEQFRSRVQALEKAVQESRADEGETSVRIYEVRPGDTLRSIAGKLYGDEELWSDLYEENHDRLQRGGDPVPGQRLVVPKIRQAAKP